METESTFRCLLRVGTGSVLYRTISQIAIMWLGRFGRPFAREKISQVAVKCLVRICRVISLEPSLLTQSLIIVLDREGTKLPHLHRISLLDLSPQRLLEKIVVLPHLDNLLNLSPKPMRPN